MMVSRLTEPAKIRKSLPLTEKDLADVARLRQETPEREALSELVGIVVVESVAEAALLRMIFEAGLAYSGEVMTGWASCDDMETVYYDEVRTDMGAVTPQTMRRVEAGLRAALGMAD